MKLLNTLIATVAVVMCASSAFAATNATVEAYAHPTLFGSQVQATQTEGVYVVGEKLLKADDVLSIDEKTNVLVDTKARNLLSDLEKMIGKFDPKKPVLRSEMAHAMSEGLGLPTAKISNKYSDVSGNWAKSYIYNVTAKGVMIGYPDKKFRPNQQITKAEVFATLAQLISIDVDNSATLEKLNGLYDMQEIPGWAIYPTKKVMATGILNNLPDVEKVAREKYLSSEQLYKLVCYLSYSKYYNAKFLNAKIKTATVKVKIKERVDARHANIGDTIYAETLADACVCNNTFAAGSLVKGEVVEVSRPGLKNPGYLKVKFNSIESDKTKVEFPVNVANASMNETKTTNFVARFFAAPFSAAARVAGVAGRTASTAATDIANSTERYGDNWSNTFANTLSLQPMAGLRSLGKTFVTAGYCVYDLGKLAVSGTFGVLYEFGDEVRYLILPSSVNDSALNPGDELTVIYNVTTKK
ncbi:MAG: S-layer homology domain-containing protein [Candidatus Gastranaerophilaceae bacterium]